MFCPSNLEDQYPKTKKEKILDIRNTAATTHFDVFQRGCASEGLADNHPPAPLFLSCVFFSSPSPTTWHFCQLLPPIISLLCIFCTNEHRIPGTQGINLQVPLHCPIALPKHLISYKILLTVSPYCSLNLFIHHPHCYRFQASSFLARTTATVSEAPCQFVYPLQSILQNQPMNSLKQTSELQQLPNDKITTFKSHGIGIAFTSLREPAPASFLNFTSFHIPPSTFHFSLSQH